MSEESKENRRRELVQIARWIVAGNYTTAREAWGISQDYIAAVRELEEMRLRHQTSAMLYRSLQSGLDNLTVTLKAWETEMRDAKQAAEQFHRHAQDKKKKDNT